ncbi:MAG TPA: hypothetical protein PK156_17975 [Polyangium sp.]|nr:hypothetical protein [Polyangium sp.]
MKNILSRFSVALAFILVSSLLASACDSDGNDPSGSSSSSSSSGGSTTGDPVLDCADTCHKLEILNCTLGGSDCNTQCTEQIAKYPPECATNVADYYACLAQNTTSCEFPMMCQSLQTALDTCQAMYGCSNDGTCSNGAGMGGEMTCGCDETCKGKSYSTMCTTAAGATMTTCDCIFEGMSLGTCQQTDANACDVQGSCCNEMYFKL